MSARAAMCHRATVERDTTAGADDWGNPNPSVWAVHIDGLPCRAWFTAGREVVGGTEKTAVIEDRRMIVPLGTDITETDRVAKVTDRRGNVLFDGPAGIEKVAHRQDHLVVFLEEVAG